MATAPRITALVTGASSGIGEALALVLARHGYGCVLVARTEERLQALAERIRRDHDVQAQVLAKDLARPDAAAEIAVELAKRDVPVDVLVNNAGLGLHGPFSETPWAAEMNLLQVNIIALTQLTKLILPRMLERRSGRILNVSSTAGLMPGPLMSVYYASKAYVLSFSEALANELAGSGITVTALCPGPTRTAFIDRSGSAPIRLFQSGVMDAHAVADAGYRALMAGKAVVIPGMRNAMLPFLIRVAPRSAIIRVTRWLNSTA